MSTSSENAALAARSLAELVGALPEIYQPIYGHPEFSGTASRDCEDRLKHIMEIYKLLEKKLGRPPRVLDLGCAQGFFSIHLAKHGASVIGADWLQPNIDVCQKLAAENPDCDLHFYTARAEHIIQSIQPDQIDIVMGLSLFHHIVHAQGKDFAQHLLEQLAEKIAVGIYEMALPNEPPAWAASQPEDPRELLEAYAFVHELARIPNHLSALERPLYIASNRFWILGGTIGAFNTHQKKSHALNKYAAQNTRRYFIGEGKFVKLYRLDTAKMRDANAREYDNEVHFLRHAPVEFQAPQLIACGKTTHEAWLAREHIPGRLLLDIMRDGQEFDAGRIVKDVLRQLAALEQVSLYHDDVRLWNVLIRENGHAALIDFGAVSKARRDCEWPYDVFLSFVVFMQELLNRDVTTRAPAPGHKLDPNTMAEPYRSIIWKLYDMPSSAPRFQHLLQELESAGDTRNDTQRQPRTVLEMAFMAMSSACEDLFKRIS